jgi:hypothetical protein
MERIHILSEEEFKDFRPRTLWASNGYKTLLSQIEVLDGVTYTTFHVYHSSPGRAMSGEGTSWVWNTLEEAVKYYNSI